MLQDTANIFDRAKDHGGHFGRCLFGVVNSEGAGLNEVPGEANQPPVQLGQLLVLHKPQLLTSGRGHRRLEDVKSSRTFFRCTLGVIHKARFQEGGSKKDRVKCSFALFKVSGEKSNHKDIGHCVSG